MDSTTFLKSRYLLVGFLFVLCSSFSPSLEAALRAKPKPKGSGSSFHRNRSNSYAQQLRAEARRVVKEAEAEHHMGVVGTTKPRQRRQSVAEIRQAAEKQVAAAIKETRRPTVQIPRDHRRRNSGGSVEAIFSTDQTGVLPEVAERFAGGPLSPPSSRYPSPRRGSVASLSGSISPGSGKGSPSPKRKQRKATPAAAVETPQSASPRAAAGVSHRRSPGAISDGGRPFGALGTLAEERRAGSARSVRSADSVFDVVKDSAVVLESNSEFFTKVYLGTVDVRLRGLMKRGKGSQSMFQREAAEHIGEVISEDKRLVAKFPDWNAFQLSYLEDYDPAALLAELDDILATKIVSYKELAKTKKQLRDVLKRDLGRHYPVLNKGIESKSFDKLESGLVGVQTVKSKLEHLRMILDAIDDSHIASVAQEARIISHKRVLQFFINN